eukprot:gene2264-2566_t
MPPTKRKICVMGFRAVGIHGYILVYSVNSTSSLEVVKVLNDKILNALGTEKTPRVLVGNKSDLEGERAITKEEGQSLANKWECAFVECSGKNNVNVEEVFKQILSEIDKSQQPETPQKEGSAKSLPELTIRAQLQRNERQVGPVLQGLDGLKAMVGKEIGCSQYLKITQDRVNDFAESTGDFQWIHVDPERAAAESPFGGAIAHGFLTLSLAAMFAEEIMPKVEGIKYGVNYGFNKVRFLSPVVVGSSVRGKFLLHEFTEVAGGAQTVIRITFEIEGGAKPAAVCDWIVRYYV